MPAPTFSGLSAQRLAELVEAIRGIAGRPDQEAAAQLDQLLMRVRRELMGDAISPLVDYERERLADSIARLRTAMDRVESGTAGADVLPLWEVVGLRNDAERLAEYADPEVSARFSAELAAVKRDALTVAAAAEARIHAHTIHQGPDRDIHSVASVRAVVNDIDAAAAALSAAGLLTPALEERARAAKTRAARFRAQRRLDEAEVALAGGNAKKADRLRKEAAVMLAQDWRQVFPGEPPPAL